MIVLSLTQAKVYFIIWKAGGCTVTQIAASVDDRDAKPTSSVARPLKSLMKYGLIEREAKNARVVTYRTIHETPPPFAIMGEEETPYEYFNEDIGHQGGVEGAL